MTRPLRIGSRESTLAVRQAEIVAEGIRRASPDIEIVFQTMKTQGDVILDRPLDKIGGKGLFIAELDEALLAGRIDLAVHSLKDMPAELADGLAIAAYSRREDPRDVLVLPEGVPEDAPEGAQEAGGYWAPLGCSGGRRKLLAAKAFPGWGTKDIRGNVPTRIAKLDAGQYGGLILAAAGLKRLGLEGRISRYLDCETFIPSAGQGILAVTCRADDLAQGRIPEAAAVDDAESRVCATAERAFVKETGGGCSAPMAAWGRIENGRLRVHGLYGEEGSTRFVTKIVDTALTGDIRQDEETAQSAGVMLARLLLAQFREGEGRGA
ncbi:MAG: hydroxymethylbilane synthase [Clostridiales Family XIII bacterium]|jgi:hydroxymethylbilane synthase|nr:hydroxymethylbilane synthase [Clostridiales Family XIII bacterium]